MPPFCRRVCMGLPFFRGQLYHSLHPVSLLCLLESLSGLVLRVQRHLLYECLLLVIFRCLGAMKLFPVMIWLLSIRSISITMRRSVSNALVKWRSLWFRQFIHHNFPIHLFWLIYPGIRSALVPFSCFEALP